MDVVALCAGISTLSATRIISHSRPAARILWHTTTTTSLGQALCLFLHSDYTTDGLQQLSFTNILSGSVAERQFINMGSGSNFFSSSEIKIDSQCCGSEAGWVFFATRFESPAPVWMRKREKSSCAVIYLYFLLLLISIFKIYLKAN